MESIYAWIEQPQPAAEKKRRYRSKHDPALPPVGSTFVPTNSRVVPGAGLSASPESPTRKPARGAGASSAGASSSSAVRARRTEERRKPAVPARSERPVMGVRTDKNFVVANAVETILAVPPQRGQGIDGSQYLHKTDYGRVPAYLHDVKREISEEKQMIEALYMNQARQEGAPTQVLTEEERAEMLAALKQKWDETNRQYQKITHMVKLDTCGKVRRKEEYERTLAQLEKDIALLQQRRPIVVVEGDL